MTERRGGRLLSSVIPDDHDSAHKTVAQKYHTVKGSCREVREALIADGRCLLQAEVREVLETSVVAMEVV